MEPNDQELAEHANQALNDYYESLYPDCAAIEYAMDVWHYLVMGRDMPSASTTGVDLRKQGTIFADMCKLVDRWGIKE